eukprot:s5971_g4.t2
MQVYVRDQWTKNELQLFHLQLQPRDSIDAAKYMLSMQMWERYGKFPKLSSFQLEQNAVDPRPPEVLRLAKLLRDFNRFAAEHASHQRDRGEPVDPLFCSLARGSFLARHKTQQAFDLRLDCCDQGKFDFLGNEACFPDWPSWSIRVCCAHALSVSASLNESGFEAFWNQVASAEPIKANPDAKPGFMNAVVVYHKAGTQLTSEIVGVSSPGPLALFLLRSPPPKVHVPDMIVLDGYGMHVKPRDGKPEIYPYFQAFTRLFADTETGEMAAHFAKPLLGDSQLQDLLASGAGRIVHITRNPTQLVMSGYVYHRKAAEVWTTFRDPPDCLNCDHEAWSQIFRRCRFRCSYAELLQNLSVPEGLEAEILRSRLDVAKMLWHARRWQQLEHVMQLSMADFQIHYNRTLECIARFFLQKPPPEALEPESLQKFLDHAQLFDPVRARRCGVRARRKGGRSCRTPGGGRMHEVRIQDLANHVADPEAKPNLLVHLNDLESFHSFLGPAGEELLEATRKSPTARKYGCP